MTLRSRPTFQGYDVAFHHLERPITDVAKIARALRFLKELREEGGTSEFTSSADETILLLAELMFDAATHLDTLWLHLHNNGTDAAKIVRPS